MGFWTPVNNVMWVGLYCISYFVFWAVDANMRCGWTCEDLGPRLIGANLSFSPSTPCNLVSHFTFGFWIIFYLYLSPMPIATRGSPRPKSSGNWQMEKGILAINFNVIDFSFGSEKIKEFQSLASAWCGFKSAFSTLLASSSAKFKFERLKKISALCGLSSSDALIHKILICSKDHDKYHNII